MNVAMNTQHFFDFLLNEGKHLPIYRDYVGDEEWFTSEIVFSINAPVQFFNGSYSAIHVLPEKIEKFKIQFSLNSRTDSETRSAIAVQDLQIDVDLTAFKSLQEWSKDLLIKLQQLIFNDALYCLRCSDSIEPEFKQAYEQWMAQNPTEPMSYTTDYKHHVFDSTSKLHQLIVMDVEAFTQPNNKYF